MTANQRRPGFRLPWSPDATDAERAPDESVGEAAQRPATTDASASSELTHADPPAATTAGSSLAADAPSADAAPAAVPDPTTDAHAVATAVEPESLPAGDEAETPPADSSPAPSSAVTDQPDFLRDLVAAMRHVADEARQAGVAEVRTRADAQVQRIEAQTERRRTELTARAEADVAGVGEWAKAEAERIRSEAEARVAARRAELDQQLAAEQARGATEAQSLRERVAEFERELGAYHAQLAEITVPAAFAAAAKRMPAPPRLDGEPSEPATTASVPAQTAAKPAPPPATERANGVAPTEPVHPAEEEVLAARLAELDAELPTSGSTGSALESITTEIVVRGLGSFGAITGFRQSLSGVEGVEAVALSLGQSGEFIFRATHRASLDVATVITSLEGEGAKIEPRTEGGLLVTLDRAR